MSDELTTIAYIAIGSNIGERYENMQQAIAHLNAHEQIEVEAESAIYETDPVGYTDQPQFLNMVIRVNTSLSPEQLLKEQLRIELVLGRKREIRFGPRTIDLDLLIYDNVSMETELLILPHPRMMERSFVLVPLFDVLKPEYYNYNTIAETAQNALQMRKEGIKKWIMTY
jgi:2-amino-4-hydroxy-6-hydroxymethyldihydropteridine diphosphokinase